MFQKHTTSCDVTILCVCCCVTAFLGITEYNKLHRGFFAINFVIAIKKINRDWMYSVLIAALAAINLQP